MQTVFSIIGIVVYGALGLLALWGAFCVILVWRRIAQVRFRDEYELDEFMDEFETGLDEGMDQALAVTEGDRRALPQLIEYALGTLQVGYKKLRRLVVERFQQDVMADIEHRLSWVATVTKSAPMVGLLGTVVGMMGAFEKIGASTKVEPTAMAQDISFALITTACGLAIAVPLVLLSAGIQIRIRKLEDYVDLGLARFFEDLHDRFGGSLESRQVAVPPPAPEPAAVVE